MSEKKIKIITDFFKKIFGDNFEIKALSRKEGEKLYINEINEEDIKCFFILSLEKNTVWYDPFNKVLFSYKPEEDSFF